MYTKKYMPREKLPKTRYKAPQPEPTDYLHRRRISDAFPIDHPIHGTLSRIEIRRTNIPLLVGDKDNLLADREITLSEDLDVHILTVSPLLDDFQYSLGKLLQEVPGKEHTIILREIFARFTYSSPYMQIAHERDDYVDLMARHPRQNKYDRVFEINHEGYKPDPAYLERTGFITSTGTRVVGKDIEDIKDTDYPHKLIFLLSVIKHAQVQIGVFAGLKIRGTLNEIVAQYLDSHFLDKIRKGTLEDEDLPKIIEPFLEVHLLPENY